MWWLAPDGHPYPAESTTFTMPTLEVPAYRARKAFADDARQNLVDLLGQLPDDLGQTRLLESIYFIGVTRDSTWDLTLYSDLLEDSAAWQRLHRGKPELDGTAAVDRMLKLCPPVATPPTAVRVFSWPGRENSDRADLDTYAQVRERFAGFLDRWAPASDIRFSNLP